MGRTNKIPLLALLLALAPSFAAAAVEPPARWIWAGVPLRPWSTAAGASYVLQGELRASGKFQHKGVSPYPAALSGPLVLTVRLSTLAHPEALKEILLGLCASWEAAGNSVAGVQLDFDSGTAHLSSYETYLRGVRGWLPARYRLSATGLGDWIYQNPLRALLPSADEIVFQLYQKAHPLPDREGYVQSLTRVARPFRVGVLEKTPLSADESALLAKNPAYRGTVTFLRAEDVPSPR